MTIDQLFCPTLILIAFLVFVPIACVIIGSLCIVSGRAADNAAEMEKNL